MSKIRPIDANALKAMNFYKVGYKYTAKSVYDAMQNNIDAAPTLDYEPVVHAHWKIKIVKTGYWYECSNCGSHWAINGETHECEQTPYCCHCGAKMDEEVKG